MLPNLFQRLFGRSDVTEPEADRLIHEVDGGLPDGRLPEDRTLCIFDDRRLVNFYEHDVTVDRQPDERWWLVPTAGLPLEIAAGTDGGTVRGTVTVRFEPETELLGLINRTGGVTTEDLLSLVTSQLAGLLASQPDLVDGEAIETLDDSARERLRARLSLLLQTRGLRCTDLGPLVFVVAATGSGERVEADGEDSSAPDPQVLAEAAEAVRSRGDWDSVVSTLEDGGCRFDAEEVVDLELLGDELVDQATRPADAAARLRELCDRARRRAAERPGELRRFRGLSLRLETGEDNEPETAVTGDVDPGGPSVVVRRRPWTWWLFNRKRVDTRLLEFLDRTLSDLRAGFDDYRTSATGGLVRLRRIDERLGLCQDLLETVPTLSPGGGNLKLDRATVRQLVRDVERAVTAAEMIQSATRQLRDLAGGEDDWNDTADAMIEALDLLAAELKARRDIR